MPATPDRGSNPIATPSCRVALGFDFGRARIGVAVGEVITGAARPLRTLTTRQQRPDWDAIARLIAEWRPDWLVVGVPRHADDTASAMTEAALRFGRQLHGRFRLPVDAVDERFSSVEADAEMRSRGLDWRQRKAQVDAEAAVIILQDWNATHARPATA